MDRVQWALTAFQNGFNCTQAVLSAFSEDLELELAAATKLAECFGGAVCNNGMPCGALLGAYMAIGLYAGRAEPGDMAAKLRAEQLRSRLYADFSAQFSATDCRALLGLDITTPEGMQLARSSGNLMRCCEYVQFAATLVEQILREEPKG